MCCHDITLHIYVVQAISSYQSLLSESPQLPYLILKHEITCIKGSKNTCFLIFYILSGTINQSIIWVASSSFMESSTYSLPDPHFKPFPFCVRESWRYQIRWIFGKVPKGRGSFSIQKSILQIFRTFGNRAFWAGIWFKRVISGFRVCFFNNCIEKIKTSHTLKKALVVIPV